MQVILSSSNAIFYDAFLDSQNNVDDILQILNIAWDHFVPLMWSYMFATICFSSVAAVVSCYCLTVVSAVIVLGLGALFLLFALLYS